jgi:dynamin 1-like protein
MVIRQSIKQLSAPSLICLQNVYDELLNQAMSIETDAMGRYHVLRESIRRQTRNIISSRKEKAEDLVKTLIDMEAALINTDHPDFLKGMTVWDLMSAAQYHEDKDPTSVTSLATHHRQKQSKATSQLALMEGWLEFKEIPSGGVKLSFKSTYTRKWCVLAKRSLVYSDTEEGENAAAIELDGATCHLAPGQSDCKLEIIPNNGSTYTFKAPDHGNATKWCHSIDIASNQESWDAFINVKTKGSTANPLFQQSMKPTTVRPGRTPSMTDSDVIQTRVVETLLNEYFEIVRKKILDSVPKAITLKLVGNVSKSLHTELVQALYDPAKVNQLLSETAETEAARERLSSVLKMMEEAKVAVQQVMIA